MFHLGVGWIQASGNVWVRRNVFTQDKDVTLRSGFGAKQFVQLATLTNAGCMVNEHGQRMVVMYQGI